MAQWVKTSTTKTDVPSLIHGIHIAGKNQFPQVVLWPLNVGHRVCACTPTHKKIRFKKFKEYPRNKGVREAETVARAGGNP